MEYIGIDIGSTCAKVAVLDEDENIITNLCSLPDGAAWIWQISLKICFWKKGFVLNPEKLGYRLWKGILFLIPDKTRNECLCIPEVQYGFIAERS